MVGGTHDKSHAIQKRGLGNVYAKSTLLNSSQIRRIAEVLVGRMYEELDDVLVMGSAKEAKERGAEGVMDMWDFNGAVNGDFAGAYLFGINKGMRLVGLSNKNKEHRSQFFDNHTKFLTGQGTPGFDEAKKWMEDYVLKLCDETADALSKKDENADDNNPTVYTQLTTKANLSALALASELLDHLIAASEAPRTACTYAQYELSRNPALQARLRAEIHTLIPPSSSPPPEIPNLRQLDSLPLLDAVLTETLRRHTATPGPQWRAAPPEGARIAGTWVPGGTVVQVSLGIMHRDEKVFPGWNEWKPERWLGSDEEEGERMKKGFWAFGRGSRGCTGREFALLGECLSSLLSSSSSRHAWLTGFHVQL